MSSFFSNLPGIGGILPGSRPKSRIFISYRRDDSGGYTGRLFDRVAELIGKDRIFMDVDAIEPGLDFGEVIERAVGSCDALLAIIGKQWLTMKGPDGVRRLDSPEDFVRLEIKAALERNIRVIPVLVGGAPMPSSAELPTDLEKLARRNAIEVSDTRFAFDADRLIEVLKSSLGIKTRQPRPASAHRRWLSFVLGFGFAALVIMAIGVKIYLSIAPEPAKEPVAQAKPTAAPAPPPTAVPKTGTLSFTTSVPARVLIDGRAVGKQGSRTYQTELASGEHTLQVTAKGFEPYEDRVRIAGGQQLALGTVHLDPDQDAVKRLNDTGGALDSLGKGFQSLGHGIGSMFDGFKRH